MKLTNGAGVDSAIEALGSEQTIQNAIKVTNPVALFPMPATTARATTLESRVWIGASAWRRKQSAPVFCPGGRLRMERLIRLLQAGRVDPTRMTTHTFEFRELGQSVRDYGQEARRGHETIDRFLIVLSAGTAEEKLASVHQFDYFGTAPFDFGTMPIGHRSQVVRGWG